MTWGIFKADSVSDAVKKVQEGVNKSDVPAYLRKKTGDQLTTKDLEKERTQNRSHPETLKKINGTNEAIKWPKEMPKDSDLEDDDEDDEKNPHRPNPELDKNVKKIKESTQELDIFSESEIDILISEVLKASDDAGKWISDFVKSDDPRFSGDSKEQRKKRALAAYYAAQKKESVDYDSFLEEAVQGEIVKSGSKEIKHANVKDKDDEKDVMEPNSKGEADFLDKHSVKVTDDPAGEYKSGGEKLALAARPVGKGAGKYDGKNKTGIKEETCEDQSTTTEEGSSSISEEKGESTSDEAGEKRAGKKTYSAFKEKMNKGC